MDTKYLQFTVKNKEKQKPFKVGQGQTAGTGTKTTLRELVAIILYGTSCLPDITV